MRYDFYNTGTYGQSPELPETVEERSRKNERKRIVSMIRAYERNPKRFEPKTVLQMQQLADRYDIAWSPSKPKASFGQHAKAGIGGILDATLALDFIPDKWYTSPGTEQTASVAKMLGIPVTIAAAIMSGGTTGAVQAAAKVSGAGLKAARAPLYYKELAGMVSKTPLGYIAKKGVEGAQRTVGPIMGRFGMAGGEGASAAYARGGMKIAGRKGKLAAVKELRTLKGGVDNARAIELLKSGGFSAKEIRKYANMVLRPAGGGRTGSNKAMLDAMVAEAMPGAVQGGKLTSSVITRLTQPSNIKSMTQITEANRHRIVEWVKRSLPEMTAAERAAIVEELLAEGGSATVKDLILSGAKMKGVSTATSTAAQLKPDFTGLAPAAGYGIGLGMTGFAGTNPDVDPLEPYYEALTGS